MREILAGSLYHCRVCNRMSVHRLQFSTALRAKPSQLLLQRCGIQTLNHGGERLAATSITTINPLIRHSGSGYHSISRCLKRFRLNVAGGRFFKGRTLFHSGIRQVVSQYLFRSPTATKITFASGGGLLLCGLGGFLFVNRDQTGHHQSETECDCEHQTQNNCDSSELLLAQTPISELSLIQQLKLVARFLFLSFLFSPALILYGVSFLSGSRDAEYLAWKYVYFAIQLAGPAFIKLGQWASTRRDIFSEDFCRALSKLHTRCSPHSWRATEQLLCENFGEDWEEKVIILDHNAIGSGCVAQVYQGYLRTEQSNKKVGEDGVLEDRVIPEGEVGLRDLREAALMVDHGYTPVAVKVLHPGIVEDMDGDIRLMKYVASWMDCVYPDLHWIALNECVEEFSMVMQQQLDLKLEAKNLLKFQDLMNGYENIKFPTPITPYVTNSVLVESFESGAQISEYLGNPGGKLQKELARIGVEVVLDMLFVHNFVHGDLHPGNILVQDPNVDDPKIVLLDCGIATSLEKIDLENFHSVFTAIVRGEGAKVADLFLGMQQCATVDKYRQDMADLVDYGVKHLNLSETQVSTLFSRVFDILIEHKVRIEPKYTSVMVAMMIIEGLGRSLDPNLDLLVYAKPCVLNRAKKYLREEVGRRIEKATERVERMKRSLSLGGTAGELETDSMTYH